MIERKPRKMTVDGIEVEVMADAADDFEIVEAIAVTSSPESTDSERICALATMYRALLGDGYRRVKQELRARNGGRLPCAAMTDFMGEVMERMGGDAKN